MRDISVKEVADVIARFRKHKPDCEIEELS